MAVDRDRIEAAGIGEARRGLDDLLARVGFPQPVGGGLFEFAQQQADGVVPFGERDLDRAELRQTVAMVFQETFLFSATVADNIAYGRPKASREEIVGAATAARDAFGRP